MFDKNSEISFPSFYIREFFRQTLEQSTDKISDDLYTMLQGLGYFLLDEKGVMPGLEKLAQYQGTNELSIFLFGQVILPLRYRYYQDPRHLQSLSS